MLIICNGVFKSGSTWLHAIIIEILKLNKIKLKNVPSKYTNNINSPTTIIESRLSEFLDTEDYIQNHYITKSHYYRKETINLNHDRYTHFFFVERDVRDAVVSHYYHIKKKYGFIKSFSIYYFLIGRLKAFEILKFNKMYLKAFGKERFIKYSEMTNDFQEVALKISSILNLKLLSEEEIEIIKKNTSMKKMREDLLLGKSRYYSTVYKDRQEIIRKGEIGDWVNHFSIRQQKDIKQIESSNILILLRIFYFFFFTLRRKIFRIE